MKRLVTIDIDVFVKSLELLVGEDEPLQAEDLFDESGLTYAGLDKIISYPKELLENIYGDTKQPLESAAAVDFNSSAS